MKGGWHQKNSQIATVCSAQNYKYKTVLLTGGGERRRGYKLARHCVREKGEVRCGSEARNVRSFYERAEKKCVKRWNKTSIAAF